MNWPSINDGLAETVISKPTGIGRSPESHLHIESIVDGIDGETTSYMAFSFAFMWTI